MVSAFSSHSYIRSRTMHKKPSTHSWFTKKFLFRASKPKLIQNEIGTIFLSTTLLFATLLSVFFASVSLTYHLKNKIALKSRLDINAVHQSVQRKNFYQKINKSNHELKLTGLAIIASQSLRPLTGPLGNLSLEALKQIHKAIYLRQNIEWKKQITSELYYKTCPTNMYSKSLCWCLLTPTLAFNPKRNPSPFPGVYGTINLEKKQKHSSSCKTNYEITQIVFDEHKEEYFQ
ncbi:MAG: hypothetical protein M9962_00290 [Oligoflexia bacterium]|nr:hypothetical protein [Oligoflexia bacterium]